MESSRDLLESLNGELPVLLNPSAGSNDGADTARELQRLFAQAGVHTRIEFIQPADIDARLAQLIDQGVKLVAIGGGDGSISAAAGALAGSQTALLPVPLGTLNHFAQRCGIPSLAAAAEALRLGAVVSIPVGEVNGSIFVNNASCGFYPQVVHHREQMRPFLSKWPAAFVAAWMVLLRRPLLELELEVGGQRLHRKIAAMWVGLGRHSLRLPQPGDVAPEGDLLEIVIPRPRRRIALFLLALRVWWRLKQNERPSNPASLETVRSSEFTLRSRRPIDIAMDGEVKRLPGPLRFRFHKGALNVLCLVANDASAE
jgi:diacylglycerol kinase family enzyme